MLQFTAQPYTIGTRTIIRLPKEISAQLASRSPVMAEVTVDGVAMRTPLEPDGNFSHWFSPPGKTADSVQVTITPTKDWPEPDIPTDLKRALHDNPTAYATWQAATPMAHWEWLRWLQSTNKTETRQRRVEVSCSKLSKGMRRPCCFNRSMCCVPEVSKNGVLLEPTPAL